jgi:hypothetical protein
VRQQGCLGYRRLDSLFSNPYFFELEWARSRGLNYD